MRQPAAPPSLQARELLVASKFARVASTQSLGSLAPAAPVVVPACECCSSGGGGGSGGQCRVKKGAQLQQGDGCWCGVGVSLPPMDWAAALQPVLRDSDIAAGAALCVCVLQGLGASYPTCGAAPRACASIVEPHYPSAVGATIWPAS